MSDPLDDHQYRQSAMETAERSWLKVVLVDLVE
jgi:hypothetical protein